MRLDESSAESRLLCSLFLFVTLYALFVAEDPTPDSGEGKYSRVPI